MDLYQGQGKKERRFDRGSLQDQIRGAVDELSVISVHYESRTGIWTSEQAGKQAFSFN